MIKMKWEKIWQNEREQWEKMSEFARFRYFLMLQTGSPYGWGEENPESSDCSGGVCMAITAATGKLIRTTADELYRKFFIMENPRPETIQAAFWITQITKNHGGTMVKPGTAVHIAGFVGPGAVLSAEEPVSVIRSLDSLSLANCAVEVRGLERGALDRAPSYGIDSQFWQYFTKE
jgi:murein DD-endopeptidase